MRNLIRKRRVVVGMLAAGAFTGVFGVTSFRSVPLAVPLPDGVVVFGVEHLLLGQGTNVLSGDAATNGQVILQHGTFVEGSLLADKGILGQDAHILGNLEADRITAPNATIEGETISPRQISDYSIPALPSITPGTQDITIGAGDTATLEPGAYDEIKIGKNATVTINGGDYHLRSIQSGRRVVFAISEPVTINISQFVSFGERTVFDLNPELDINQVRINFHGQNLTVGKSSFAAGVIHAPNGLVFIHKDSVWRGQVAAKRVGVGKNTIIARGVEFAKSSDPTKIIEDPDGGFVVADEIVVNLEEGVSVNSFVSALEAIGGQIVGFLDLTNEYKIRIQATTITDLNSAVAALENADIPGLTSVEKNALVFPN